MRNRRIAVFVALALVAVAVARHPSADLRVLLHDPADLAPHRIQAAVDLGVMAVSVLITWTSHRFA
ncbi:hypothetical protein PX554_16240 [Sphingomonas sp. H39-1-10]|uniref:hypothetical protein n=1 Tax=Sphingomonas pollutisoli TaxID=3030829 RepID=UPI0023B95FB7|nr:hypothetical protein [Sphingomonas pollutisoli]MDF0489684.1 hypothetical protein [Sphingomonas pollutisoli]